MFYCSKQAEIEIQNLIVRVNEAEAKLKSEVARLKKKYQSEIAELEMALESSNSARAEAERKAKAFAAQLKVNQ